MSAVGMLKASTMACLLAFGASARADVAVNNDGSVPDSGAILDVKADDDSHFVILKADGRVGISTTDVTEGLHLDVEGNIGAQLYCDENGENCGTTADFLSGGGGGGGSVWLESGNVVFRTSGRVGIGTSNPSKELEVIGSIRASESLCIGEDCRTAWPDIDAADDWNNNASGDIFRLTGNVGIGVSVPEARLHVDGPGLFEKLKLADTGGNSLSWEISEDQSNNLVGFHGEEVFRFDPLGNFGLGISPSARLHIGGVSRPSLAFTKDDNSSTTWSMVAGSNNYFFIKPALPSVQGNDTDAVMTITPSGSIGIGNQAPTHKLHVTGDINFTGEIYKNGLPFTTAATHIDAL
ncbi:MAG: hypothetical protein KAG66_20090, partial [Methylococcales bacterium]|nr:hypothetical protein [Methylococcales bacterium]